MNGWSDGLVRFSSGAFQAFVSGVPKTVPSTKDRVSGYDLVVPQEETLSFTRLPRKLQQLVGAAYEFFSVSVAPLFGEQALAGALQHRDDVLQLDLGGIGGWDEIIERVLDVVFIYRGFLAQGGAHAAADKHGFDVGAGKIAGAVEKEFFEIGGKRRHPAFLHHGAE